MAKKLAYTAVALSFTVILSGCASNPSNKQDPYEPFNRAVFAVNTKIDHWVMRPVTSVYTHIVPPPLQKGVSNFFDNADMITTMTNDTLQGNFKYAVADFWRLTVNTIFGLGGLFDVATPMGIPKRRETFGMTFAKWRGGRTSPYLVLPLLGPSTVQNAFGFGAGIVTKPWFWLNGDDPTQSAVRYAALGLRIIDTRAKYMDTNKLVDNAFDPYAFVRDAYLQSNKRRIEKNQLGDANDQPVAQDPDAPAEQPADLPEDTKADNTSTTDEKNINKDNDKDKDKDKDKVPTMHVLKKKNKA